VSAEHKRIFEATIARDSAAATEAMVEHLRLTAEIITGSLKLEDQREDRRRQNAG
jgi:DNA-binding GntR family transcriptional regulator